MAMDDTIRVELTEAEKAERGERLARLLKEREAMEQAESKRRASAKEDLEAHQVLIDECATELREGRTEKRQGDLFHEEKPTPAEAPQLLTDIASRAAAAPQPGEVHAFQGPEEATECELCGSGRTDVVHATAMLAHPYMPTQGEPGDPCGYCDAAGFVGRASDPIHVVEEAPAVEGAVVDAEMPAAAPTTLAWDPHAFTGAGKGTEEDPFHGPCEVCDQEADDSIHTTARFEPGSPGYDKQPAAVEEAIDEPIQERRPPRTKARRRRADRPGAGA